MEPNQIHILETSGLLKGHFFTLINYLLIRKQLLLLGKQYYATIGTATPAVQQRNIEKFKYSVFLGRINW